MATNVVTHATEMREEGEILNDILGEDVKAEITKAVKILNDFARYNMNLKKDYDSIVEELNACRKKGQVPQIMRKVRHSYL